MQFSALLESINKFKAPAGHKEHLSVSDSRCRLLPNADLMPKAVKDGWVLVEAQNRRNENLLIMFHGLGDNAGDLPILHAKQAT